MLLLLVTIYTVTHIALQTNKNNVTFPLSQWWFMGFLLQIWPAGLDMKSNSPEIYSFCLNLHPEQGFFFLNHKAFVTFGVLSSHLVPHNLTPTPPHTSPFPNLSYFFQPHFCHFHVCSVHVWKWKHQSIVQSSWYLCPAWKQKLQQASFPTVSSLSSQWCLSVHGRTQDSPLDYLLPYRFALHQSAVPALSTALDFLLDFHIGKPNHVFKALAGPTYGRGNMLRTLRGNNNYTCDVQGVLGVAKCKSIRPFLHLRFRDFKGPAESLHSQELLQPDTNKF